MLPDGPEAPKLYLAGPEVFLPDAGDVGRAKQALCRAHGFVGLFPLDNEIPAGSPLPLDRAIYCANHAMIRDADGGIFNLTPFRGSSADAGTVFELGMMIALGKPVFAYSNEDGSLLDRVKTATDLVWDSATGAWRDGQDMVVEDFGNVDNLMIDAAIAEQGRGIHRRAVSESQRFRDLDGFAACLREARAMLTVG